MINAPESVLNEKVKEILKSLTSQGNYAYVMGGAIRDSLISGIPMDDKVRIVTNRSPSDITKILGPSVENNPNKFKVGNIKITCTELSIKEFLQDEMDYKILPEEFVKEEKEVPSMSEQNIKAEQPKNLKPVCQYIGKMLPSSFHKAYDKVQCEQKQNRESASENISTNKSKPDLK